MRIKVDEDLPLGVAVLLRGQGYEADTVTEEGLAHAGVLLLRPDEDGIRPVVELLRDVLEETDLNSLAQAVAVATPRGLRVRWPPRG